MDESLTVGWQAALDKLQEQGLLTPASHGILEISKPLGMIADTLVVATPSTYAKNFIDTNLIEPLTAAYLATSGKQVKIAVSVDDSMPLEPASAPPSSEPAPAQVVDVKPQPRPEPVANMVSHVSPSLLSEAFPPPAPEPEPQTAPSNAREGQQRQVESTSTISGSHLNPGYTFSSFVIGSSNRFATAAATAVAENPGHTYNPLFIFGGSGLGKTHLLHAIGHEALSLHPGLRVKFVSSEEFTNDFINSIGTGRALEFQNRYRAVDILLLDDIQFLQGKEQTIEEFFHTFNALHNQGSAIVITSDLPPRQLGGFAERMRSRFEWGLQVDIQPADLETRIAILASKARQENVQIDLQVLEYIAERFSTNIRELEGALVRVMAFASLSKQPITTELAAVSLQGNISDPATQEITPSLIKSETAKYFSVTVDALCSSSRSRALTEARQIAMYLCRELTDLSLPAIGQEFGGRDHTTVIHANRKIAKSMASNPQVYNNVTQLTSIIRTTARKI